MQRQPAPGLFAYFVPQTAGPDSCESVRHSQKTDSVDAILQPLPQQECISETLAAPGPASKK